MAPSNNHKKPSLPIEPRLSIDKIVALDNVLQVLPALSATLVHNEQPDITDFDLREHVIKMRRYSAMQDILCGSDFYKSDHLINNTKILRIFFDKSIIANIMPKDYTDKIFELLNNMLDSSISQGLGTFLIKKNTTVLRDYPYCPQPISEILFNTTNKIHRHTIHCKYDPSKSNIKTYERRIEETCELYDELKNNNHIKNLKEEFPALSYTDGIHSKMSFPFIGTIDDKEYSGETVVYFLSHYEFEDADFSLKDVRFQITNLFKEILQNNQNLTDSIRECASMNDSISHPAILTSLFTRIPESKEVFTIFFLMFFEDKQFLRGRFPLYPVQDYIRKHLGWEVETFPSEFQKFKFW